MKKPNLQGFIFLVLLLFVLIGTGCGGGTNQGKDAANIGGSVGGYGIDGLIINGDVYIYGYNGARGDLLAQAKTDASGQFSATIGNYSGPILIEVRNGYYVEEASGYRVDLNVADYLSALTFYSAGGSISNLMVTPMTTLAASLAGYYQGAGDNVSNAINKANTALSSLILIDILDTYPADLTDEKNKPGGATNSAKYGTVLAALSQMSADISAQNNTQPHRVYNSMALTKALAIDISDGKINGKKGQDDVYLGITKLDSYTMRRALGVAAINFMNTTYNKSGLARGDVENYLSQIAANSGSLFPSDEKPKPIDDVPPIITFTEPIANSYVAGKLKVRVVATDFSDIKALTVTSPSFPNTIFFDYDGIASVYLLEVDTTTIADGNLTFNVSATDAADNTSIASITVVVDNKKPQVNITSPATGSYTNLNLVTVTGTIIGAGSGVASLNFVRGSESTAATVNGKSFTANLNVGADGRYDYTVTITDNVGNQASSIYTLLKDTVLPRIDTLQPSYYYDETKITATVDSNSRIVSYGVPSGLQQDAVQEVNFTINKFITRLSSGNSYLENVLDWKQGNYDYNIPYYKFSVTDSSTSGIGTTDPDKLIVTYQFSQFINNNWVVKRDYASTPSDNSTGTKYYIIPISTEYLGPDIATVANDVNNMVTVKMVDEAGNIGYKYFYFKMNLLGPPVITIYDQTLSASPYFTKADSVYIYNFASRQSAYGGNLKAMGVLISNPNPVTVYVDTRVLSSVVILYRKVIAVRGADTTGGASYYGGEYASKDNTYALNLLNFYGGFRDVLTQQLITPDTSGYYPLLPGQTAVAYNTFANYGYGVFNSGLAWNWQFGVTNPSLSSCGAFVPPSNSTWSKCVDPGTGRYLWYYTTIPQYVVIDDYSYQYNLNWAGNLYSGPYLKDVNTNNFTWNTGWSINGSIANWNSTQSSNCTSWKTSVSCINNALNNANTSARVQQALP